MVGEQIGRYSGSYSSKRDERESQYLYRKRALHITKKHEGKHSKKNKCEPCLTR